MYCNQCGYEMKDTANFCKNCGAPVDPTKDISEIHRKVVRFLYLNKVRILICFIALLFLCGAAVAAVTVWKHHGENEKKQTAAAAKTVSSVDLKTSYKMEDNRLVLDPLHATYSDGTVQELLDYQVFVDGQEARIEENAIDAEDLYDRTHLIRLQWTQNGQPFQYEKSVALEHKKETWQKYPDLVGMTGRQISQKYGSMGAPQFGSFHEGDLGRAYVQLSEPPLQLCFPAGILDRPEDYGDSNEVCIEVSGTLSDFFYNMEPEMSKEELSQILDLNLYDSQEGGCTAVLGSGKRMYIGTGQVQDNVYTPSTSIRVTVSEEDEENLWQQLF